MGYVILDLEFNGAYSKKFDKFINEIIEFGAIKLDNNLNIVDKFSMLVKPQIRKSLNSRVKELTNISSLELSKSSNFECVLEKFKIFLGSDTLITWGISDIQVLIQNYNYYYNNIRIPFIKKFINLQKYCQDTLKYNQTQQLGLLTTVKLLNIDETYIEHHRALDDSILSLKCLKKIYNNNFFNYIQNADCNEFFDEITFKVTFIKNLNHPLFHSKDIEFKCEKCKTKSKKISSWKNKGNNHIAKFKCPNCKNEFIGKLQLKSTYNGIIVKKKIIPQESQLELGENYDI